MPGDFIKDLLHHKQWVAQNMQTAADLLSTNPLGKAGLYKAYPVVTLATGPVSMDAQTLQVISEP